MPLIMMWTYPNFSNNAVTDLDRLRHDTGGSSVLEVRFRIFSAAEFFSNLADGEHT